MPLVLAPFLISGLVFLAALVLIALNHTFNAWFGSQTQTGNTGGLWGALQTILTAPIRAIVGTAQKVARTTVSHWALAHVKPITRWFHALAVLTGGTFAEIANISIDTKNALERLVHVTIPRIVGKEIAPIKSLARKGLNTATLARQLGLALSNDLAHFKGFVFGQIKALHHAIDVTLPKEIGRIGAGEKALEREIPVGLRSRLKSLEKYVFGGAIVGLIIRTLARRFPWLFCRNVQNVGKRVCGMNQNLLQALLADTAVISGAISIVELAKACQALTPVVESALKDFIAEVQ